MVLYYFIDTAGERKLIGSGNIRWTGTWSGSTSYQVKNAATDAYGHNWMALVANTNVALPSTFDSAVPTTWTHLVLAETSPLSPEDQAIATASEAMALGTVALATAWAGTTVANSAGTAAGVAYNLALLALSTAWAGTAAANQALAEIGTAGTTAIALAISLANQALVTAWAGTAANLATNAVATTALTTAWVGTTAAAGAQGQADAAYGVATAALTTAWTGTDLANAVAEYAGDIDADTRHALVIASAGTGTADQAMAVATAALSTSWVGTGAAAESHAVAQTALETAWVGTATASAGGVAYSLGRAALDTAWVGTATGYEARTVALSALEATWAGTTSGSLNHAFTNITNTFAQSQIIDNGTLQIVRTYNELAATHHALKIDITNTASSNTSSAVYVTTGNSEVFRIDKAGGIVISGSYGVIGSNSLGIGMESVGAYLQGFGGKPIFLQPIGNNVGVSMGAVPTSRFEIGQSWGRTGTLITNPIILTDIHNVVIANTTSAPITVSLPAVVAVANRIYTIKKMDNSVNTVTILAADDERIDDQKSYALTAKGQMLEVICVSGTWVSLGTN